MLLKINNVGRLKPAEIKIDGLTVICGNNNTGKSTIGKLIYCIYSAFYEIDLSIRKEKKDLIRRYLQMQLLSPNRWTVGTLNEAIEELIDLDSVSEKTVQTTVDNIMKKISSAETRSTHQEIVEEVRRILLVDREEVIMTFLKRYLNTEFEGHLGNVNHPRKKTTVDLSIHDQHIAFSVTGVKEYVKIDRLMSLEKQIIYLDDPFVLDHVNDMYFAFPNHLNYGHRYQISDKIRSGRVYGEPRTAVEEVLHSQKLKDIIKKINDISDGEVAVEDGKLVYQHANLQTSLGMSSLSTGVKTFLVLKELLVNGDIEENGIVVIDEPEVHLHPEWQIKYAEVIVMLQKAYGLNIVLTTHSMDFLSALVHYSKKYGIEDFCNYYLTEIDKGSGAESFPLAQLKWMNKDIQGMYASIAEPFDKLYKQMDLEDAEL